MSTPLATITDTTSTGDVITGPGAVTTLAGGLPVSCIGDAVTGSACTGVISSTLSPTNMAGGLPVASLGCTVTGVSSIGTPVTTAIAVCSNVTELV